MSTTFLAKIRNRFLFVVLAVFLVVATVLYNFYSLKTVLDFSVGFFVSFLDNIIMFWWGINKGSKQSQMAESLAIMQKNMFQRIAFLLVTCLLLNKLTDINVVWVFTIFLILHIGLLLFLIVNAWLYYDET